MKKLLILALVCAYGISIHAMENEEAKDPGLIKQPAKKAKELTYEQKLYKEFKKNIKNSHPTRLKKTIKESKSQEVFFNKDQKINLIVYAQTIKKQESARMYVSLDENWLTIKPGRRELVRSTPVLSEYHQVLPKGPQEACADPKLRKKFEKSCKVLFLIKNLETKEDVMKRLFK